MHNKKSRKLNDKKNYDLESFTIQLSDNIDWLGLLDFCRLDNNKTGKNFTWIPNGSTYIASQAFKRAGYFSVHQQAAAQVSTWIIFC